MLLERIRGYFTPRATSTNQRAAERRRAARKAVYLRATIYPIDVFSDARIRDVSATGARGEADVELAIGQTLHLTLDQKSYHTGKVKWTLNRQFGLDLADAARIFGAAPAEIDHGSSEGHHPRSPRVKVDVAARMVGGRPPRPAIVRNVSQFGMLLDTGPGIAPGQHLVIQVGKAPPIYGRVQWSSQGRVGVKAEDAFSAFALTCPTD
jgi:hypothetical protein|uniref:PilZ domain-containing protein n=1 Tax=uncultured Sphingomonas sp. TaxID=158754 RepID=UPI0035C9FA7F